MTFPSMYKLHLCLQSYILRAESYMFFKLSSVIFKLEIQYIFYAMICYVHIQHQRRFPQSRTTRTTLQHNRTTHQHTTIIVPHHNSYTLPSTSHQINPTAQNNTTTQSHIPTPNTKPYPTTMPAVAQYYHLVRSNRASQWAPNCHFRHDFHDFFRTPTPLVPALEPRRKMPGTYSPFVLFYIIECDVKYSFELNLEKY